MFFDDRNNDLVIHGCIVPTCNQQRRSGAAGSVGHETVGLESFGQFDTEIFSHPYMSRSPGGQAECSQADAALVRRLQLGLVAKYTRAEILVQNVVVLGLVREDRDKSYFV